MKKTNVFGDSRTIHSLSFAWARSRRMLRTTAGLAALILMQAALLHAQDAQQPTSGTVTKAAWSVPAGNPGSLKNLMGDSVNSDVVVCGKISNKIPATSERAPNKWYVTDGKGVVMVVLFPNLYKNLKSTEAQFPIGGLIQVRGTVKEHQGVLQLAPNALSDLTVASAETPQGVWGARGGSDQKAAPVQEPHQMIAGAVPPSKINKELANKPVTVAGKVSAFRAAWSETAPSILTLEGDGATVDVVYWSAVDKALGDKKDKLTAMGASVAAKGKVKEFRGKLQVNIDAADDLTVLGASSAPAAPADQKPSAAKEDSPAKDAASQAPAAASSESKAPSARQKSSKSDSNEPPVPMTPSKISKADVGKNVVVHGKVESVQPSPAERTPTRVVLADDNGSVQVVYWKDNEAEFSGEKAPQEGKPWGVVGQVGERQGRIQVRAKKFAP